MPERFGPWSKVYQRFRDWHNRGAFVSAMVIGLHHQVFATLLSYTA
jgi:transposase